MSTRFFSQVLVWGFVAPPHPRSLLAVIVYRLRLEVARRLLQQWSREGWTHVAIGLNVLAGRLDPEALHPIAVRPRPESNAATWPIGSPQALQLLAAALAMGAEYDDIKDPVGPGPGFADRARELTADLEHIAVARAEVA